jgi:XTP/dITP diphosphohydrolase
MTKSKTIHFITSNQRKFTSLQRLLQPLGINLQQLDYDFDEGRGLDIQTIAKSKLSQAKKAFPNKCLIVDDRG